MNNSKKQGLGVYLWNSGQVYLGGFVKDKLEGAGLVVLEEGHLLAGMFHDSKAEGLVYFYNNQEQEVTAY